MRNSPVHISTDLSDNNLKIAFYKILEDFHLQQMNLHNIYQTGANMELCNAQLTISQFLSDIGTRKHWSEHPIFVWLF